MLPAPLSYSSILSLSVRQRRLLWRQCNNEAGSGIRDRPWCPPAPQVWRAAPHSGTRVSSRRYRHNFSFRGKTSHRDLKCIGWHCERQDRAPGAGRIYQSPFHDSEVLQSILRNEKMSDEHDPPNGSGAGEDHISMPPEEQSRDHVSELAPENTADLQEHPANPEASLLESSSEESENSSSSVSSSQSSESQNPDGKPVPMSDMKEATTEFPFGESSLGENTHKIDEGNADGFKSERKSESNREDLFSPSSAQASENDRRQEGKEVEQKGMNTMETQTTWISLNTPGSSVTEFEMGIPNQLQSHSLDSSSWILDLLTDSEKEVTLKKFESDFSLTEETDYSQTESRSEESDYEDADASPTDKSTEQYQVAVVKTSKVVHCDFCKQERMPFPMPQQLDTTTPDMLFCCNMSWELYQQILRRREEDPDYVEAESDEESFHATILEMEEAEKKVMERLKNPEVTMYMTSLVHGDEVIFTTMKTISYKMSSEYYRKQGWTLGVPLAKPVMWEEFSRYVPVALSDKKDARPRNIVVNYYPDGSKFLIMFPDGTSTVFYPSGNVAIQTSALYHDQLVYVIFEDLDLYAKMLGVFQSTGHGTCYHPNGQIWINMTPLHGFYFTEQGLVKKHWQWRDFSHHVHAPPYNSISLKLTPCISIHIISQDQIYTTFKRMKRRIRFNMGAKLLRNLVKSHAARSSMKEEENYMKKAKEKINMLLKQLRRRK